MNDELLIKFLLKETSSEENEQVNSWIAASAGNRQHFARFELLWNASSKLAATGTADEHAAWQRFRKRAAERPAPAVRPLFSNQLLFKVAAVLLLAAGIWTVYRVVRPDYITLASNRQVLTEKLPDGSEVTLNRNAILSYGRFSGRQRNVTLEKGEVFFKVNHDKTRPFIIAAGNVTVQVLGTSFNVKHAGNTTEVIVETGMVSVRAAANTLRLLPGQKVTVNHTTGSMQKQDNTDQLYQYFRSRVLIADHTPLWRLVEVLNEAYGADISIENARLRNLTLTTTFRNEPLDNILNVIAGTLDIRVVHTGGKIILK